MTVVFFIMNVIVLDRIAFNQNGSIFFNLRYFEQVFANNLDSKSSDSTLIELINFYFIVTCHELTHNQHKGHGPDFTSDMETIIVKFLPKKEKFLKKFSFPLSF